MLELEPGAGTLLVGAVGGAVDCPALLVSSEADGLEPPGPGAAWLRVAASASGAGAGAL